MADVMTNSDAADRDLARLAAELSTALDRVGSHTSLDRQLKLDEVEAIDAAEKDDPSPILASLPAVSSQPETGHSSPVAQFATPGTLSPENEFVELKQTSTDSQSKRGKKGSISSTTSSRPSLMARARSNSSSNVLNRLTSRGSVKGGHKSNDSNMSATSFATSTNARPKLDRAALSQQREKYKSGVNWEKSDLMLNQTEEPFEESSSPVEERDARQLLDIAEQAHLRELASAGGTKAALAQANANSMGTPYFPVAEKSAWDVSTTRNTVNRPLQRSSPTSPTGESKPTSMDATNEKAQQVLESARIAVAMSNAAARQNALTAQTATASPTETNDDKAVPEATEDKEPTVLVDAPPRKGRRLSFMSFGSSSSSKKAAEAARKTDVAAKAAKSSKKKGKDSSETEKGKSTSPPSTLRKSPSTVSEATTTAATVSAGTGTGARQRRFRDTRELGLVASQLAAEALMPTAANAQPVVGDSRQAASMMSILAASNENSLPPPQPAFAAAGSASSSRTGSPYGSPRHTVMELSRHDSPRAAFARVSPMPSPTGSPFMTQSAKIEGLPSDMLTGLSDGPYPSLPPRSMDFADPFGTSVASLDSESHIRQNGGRMSLPNAGLEGARKARQMSSGSLGPSAARRSVLTMSMYNPEQEMQGLTKKPKSSRSTPFGSRAPSRQATPKTSAANLRDLAKAEAAVVAAALAEAAPETKAANANVNANVKGKSLAKEGGGSRLSFFKKNKSSNDLAGNAQAERTSTESRPSHALKPLSSSAVSSGDVNRTSVYSKLSVNESVLSHGRSMTTAATTSNDNDSLVASRPANDASTNSLVKVPSSSMTSTSASSHERSSNGSSSDGYNSTQVATSAVTTPEVAPSKMDLSPPPMSYVPQPTASPSSPENATSLPGQQQQEKGGPATAAPTSSPLLAIISQIDSTLPSAQAQTPVSSAHASAARQPSQADLRSIKAPSKFGSESTTIVHEPAAARASANPKLNEKNIAPTASSNGKKPSWKNGFAVSSKGASQTPSKPAKRRGDLSSVSTPNIAAEVAPSGGGSKFSGFKKSLKRDWFI